MGAFSLFEPFCIATVRGVLAHPLTEPFGLPVSPVVVASIVAAATLVVSFGVPARDARRAGSATPDARRERGTMLTSWEGPLASWHVATRVAAFALVVLAILAGRLGEDDELANLAPAFVVGVAWPMLVLASALIGPVWRWVDPWDSTARLVGRAGPQTAPAASVWPAAFVLLPWVWYLSAYPDPLAPGSVGAILAIYSVVTIAGCLAVGRVRWLSSAEPLGLVLSWVARLPTRRLATWSPPRGAELVLGALAGGVLFGAARRSELWGELNAVRAATALATVGVAASSAVVALYLWWQSRRAVRGGSAGSVARASLPAVVGIVLAVAMDRNRLTTSLQLLPSLLGDPFGRGWDLFGGVHTTLDAAPFGTVGLLWVQVGIVALGHLVGAWVLARSEPRSRREPAAGALGVLAIGSTIAVITH